MRPRPRRSGLVPLSQRERHLTAHPRMRVSGLVTKLRSSSPELVSRQRRLLEPLLHQPDEPPVLFEKPGPGTKRWHASRLRPRPLTDGTHEERRDLRDFDETGAGW